MGLKTRIWASRLGYGPRGWKMGLNEVGGGAKKEEKEEKEKIPQCESIGH